MDILENIYIFKFSVGRYTGDVGLVKDLDTGTYFYVVKDNAAQQEATQKEKKYFPFTSEELKSEKWIATFYSFTFILFRLFTNYKKKALPSFKFH